MNSRILGKHLIFVFAAFTILLQIVFLFEAKNSLSVNLITGVEMQVKIGVNPIVNDMSVNGNEMLEAVIPTLEITTIDGTKTLSKVVFFVDDPETSGDPDFEILANHYGTSWYSSNSLSSLDLQNKSYRLYAKAFYGTDFGYVYEFPRYSILVNRLMISFTEDYSLNPISGNKTIYADVNKELTPPYDSMNFYIHNSSDVYITSFTGTKDPANSKRYYFIWDTSTYTDSQYILKAWAYKMGGETVEKKLTVSVNTNPTFILSPVVSEISGYPSKRLMKVYATSTPADHKPTSITGKIKNSSGYVVGSTFSLTYQTGGYWTYEYDTSSLSGNYNFCASGMYNATSIPWVCTMTAFSATATEIYSISPSVVNWTDPYKKLKIEVSPTGILLYNVTGKIRRDSATGTVVGSEISFGSDGTSGPWMNEYNTSYLLSSVNYYFCANAWLDSTGINRLAETCATTAFTKTTASVPTAPSNLRTEGTITSSSIPLIWTDNSNNENRFKIERKLHSSTSYSPLSEVGTDITSFTDTSVTASSVYDYKVMACNISFCSAYAELTSVSTPFETTPVYSISPSVVNWTDPYKKLKIEVSPTGILLYNVTGKIRRDSATGTVVGSEISFGSDGTSGPWMNEYNTSYLLSSVNYYFCANAWLDSTGINRLAETCATTAFTKTTASVPTFTLSPTVNEISGSPTKKLMKVVTTSAPSNYVPTSITGKIVNSSNVGIELFTMTYNSTSNHWTYEYSLSNLTSGNYTFCANGMYNTTPIPWVCSTTAFTVTTTPAPTYSISLSVDPTSGTYKKLGVTVSPAGTILHNVTGKIRKDSATGIVIVPEILFGATGTTGPWINEFDTSSLTSGMNYYFCATAWLDSTGTNRLAETCSATAVTAISSTMPAFTFSPIVNEISGYPTKKLLKATYVSVPSGKSLTDPMGKIIDQSGITMSGSPFYLNSDWTKEYDTSSLATGSYLFCIKGKYLTTYTNWTCGTTAFTVSGSTDPVIALKATIQDVSSAYPTISGTKLISISSEPAGYNFSGVVGKIKKGTEIKIDNLAFTQSTSGWSGSLNTNTSATPNGDGYVFCASGNHEGKIYENCSIPFSIKNSTDVMPVFKINVWIEGLSGMAEISGTKTIRAAVSSDPASFSLSSLNLVIAESSGSFFASPILSKNQDGTWSAVLDTNTYPNSEYKIHASGLYNGKAFDSNVVYIRFNNTPTATSATSSTASSQTATTTTVADKPFISISCQEKGITDETDCNNYLSIRIECRNAGIMDKTECSNFMFSIAMAPICIEKGVKTQEECSKLILLAELPKECAENNITNSEECAKFRYIQSKLTDECKASSIKTINECDNHMFTNFPPEPCKKANAKTKDECAFIMRNLPATFVSAVDAPDGCKSAGISSKIECENFMLKKHMPDECIASNMTSTESCRTLMFEKYADIKDIPIDKFPQECKNSGITTSEKCKSVMQAAYLPNECRKHGYEHNECASYLKIKNVSDECIKEKIASKSDCDKFKYEKYIKPVCNSAGIADRTECENFIFNKFITKIKCESLEDWECKNRFRNDFLVSIASKQATYDIIDKKKDVLSEKTMSVVNLEKEISSDPLAKNEYIPLAEKNTNVKIIRAESSIMLDSNENMVETAPIIVMIDTDGDGLSDDMENILGTDPDNTDTDGDGYKDGEETRTGHDPLGPGYMTRQLAPAEKAFLENKPLEHPKTSGETSGSLSIDGISNLTKLDGTNKMGYLLTGKSDPDSIITLYVYSDLPLVMTVKANAQGDWEYRLDRPLSDGEHEVYVVVNDETGKIAGKSKPSSLFVKQAKAVSASEYLGTTINELSTKTGEESRSSRYGFVVVLSIIAALCAFGAMLILRKRKHHSQK